MLRLLSNLTLADFEQMAALEARCYGSEFIAPAEEAHAWYQRFPYTTVALGVDAGSHEGCAPGRIIAGFVNLFPVIDEVYTALRAGQFNDAELTVGQIADIAAVRPADEPAGAAAPLHMFLSCIALEPQYRGKGLARRLLVAATNQYRGVESQIDAIVTDNVTPEGVRFSRRYGFELVGPSNHGSQVFAQPYARFLTHVRG